MNIPKAWKWECEQLFHQSNQVLSVVHTSACIFNVDTKKNETIVFRSLSFARSSKTKGGLRVSEVKRLLSKLERLTISPNAK